MYIKSYFKEDKGAALLVALLVGMVLIMIVMGAHNLTTTHSREGQVTAAYEDSFQNAEAGVNWFLFSANEDTSFVRKLIQDEIDLEEMVENGEAPEGVEELNFYTEEVTNGGGDYTPVNMYLEATGSAENPVTDGDLTRTVRIELENRQFVQYVWNTNDEVLLDDPDDPDNPDDDEIIPIWFSDSANLEGPVHSDGWIFIHDRDLDSGPVFHDDVTYGNQEGGVVYAEHVDLPSRPTLEDIDEDDVFGYDEEEEEAEHPWNIDSYEDRNFLSGRPEAVPPQDFPMDNTGLRDDADETFNGLTRIYLDGDRIEIREDTESTTTFYELNDYDDGMVIYVNCVDSDPDKWNENTGNVFISGELDGRLTVAAERDIWITGYNPVLDWDGEAENDETTGIQYADADNWDWNDIECDNAPDSMLGLSAGRNVSILHKGWFDCLGEGNRVSAYGGANELVDFHVHATVFALDGEFKFEDHNEGVHERGIVRFRGSAIQDSRGAFGIIGREGYRRDFRHDSRLLYDMPPHFLEPSQSGWTIEDWRETTMEDD